VVFPVAGAPETRRMSRVLMNLFGDRDAVAG
jgi:hypothetical protein